MCISDPEKLLACIKIFFDILYVVYRISKLAIYCIVFMSLEEGFRPVIISRGMDR